MIEESEKKVRNRYPDRLSIDPVNLEKIGRLLEQLHSNIQGSDASRKEILNWMIEKFPEQLAPSDLKELSERFYDEERFLRLALDEIKNARTRGERLTLDEILKRKNQDVPSIPRRTRKRKSDEAMGEAQLIETAATANPEVT